MDTVCVEFDGVIHNYKGHTGSNGGKLGLPNPLGLELLRNLQKNFYRIVIVTDRDKQQRRLIYQWMHLHVPDVSFDLSLEHVPSTAFVSSKSIHWPIEATESDLAVTMTYIDAFSK